MYRTGTSWIIRQALRLNLFQLPPRSELSNVAVGGPRIRLDIDINCTRWHKTTTPRFAIESASLVTHSHRFRSVVHIADNVCIYRCYSWSIDKIHFSLEERTEWVKYVHRPAFSGYRCFLHPHHFGHLHLPVFFWLTVLRTQTVWLSSSFGNVSVFTFCRSQHKS